MLDIFNDSKDKLLFDSTISGSVETNTIINLEDKLDLLRIKFNIKSKKTPYTVNDSNLSKSIKDITPISNKPIEHESFSIIKSPNKDGEKKYINEQSFRENFIKKTNEVIKPSNQINLTIKEADSKTYEDNSLELVIKELKEKKDNLEK